MVRFKISPALVDGDHWSIIDDRKVLIDIIDEWCKNPEGREGECFRVRIVNMSDEKVAALPEL